MLLGSPLRAATSRNGSASPDDRKADNSCAECITDWKKKEYHVDLWMGPSFEQNAKPLYACEDKLTQGNGPGHGTGTIIVNPAKDLPVDTTPLYLNGKCTTHIYPN